MLLYYKKFFHILMMCITYSNSFLTPPACGVKNIIPKSELIFAINDSQKATHMEGCH